MNNEKRTGPEFAPIREYVSSLKIKVIVYDKDDNVIREERMDYGNVEDRRWLGKLSFWAWSNDHTVETSAEGK